MDWFKEEGWDIAEHPACSPHLNPIEHVWAFLKKALHKKYPNIIDTTGAS